MDKESADCRAGTYSMPTAGKDRRHDVAAQNSGSSSYNPRSQFECPNCRGPGTVIAVWHYIDENRVTQEVGGQRAEHLLESTAVRYSLSGGDIVTPPSQPSTPRSDTPFSIVQPPLFQGEPGSSTMYSHDHFHIHTQLPDGRQSILIDPGPVGNMCGDKWARNVARMTHRMELSQHMRKEIHH